jgi:hypothetical protein
MCVSRLAHLSGCDHFGGVRLPVVGPPSVSLRTASVCAVRPTRLGDRFRETQDGVAVFDDIGVPTRGRYDQFEVD